MRTWIPVLAFVVVCGTALSIVTGSVRSACALGVTASTRPRPRQVPRRPLVAAAVAVVRLLLRRIQRVTRCRAAT